MLLLSASGIAAAIDSFLDGNPKAPEAIPYRRAAPTPAATPLATPS